MLPPPTMVPVKEQLRYSGSNGMHSTETTGGVREEGGENTLKNSIASRLTRASRRVMRAANLACVHQRARRWTRPHAPAHKHGTSGVGADRRWRWWRRGRAGEE